MAADDLPATEHLVRQHGLITRAQALDLGYSRHQIQRRLSQGVWTPADRGVYRHHLYPPTWSNRLLAVCLGADAVASHRSGAVLWGLDGIRRGRPEVTVPAGTRLRRIDVRVHETTQWDRIARRSLDGIPVTGIDRTLLDLAWVVHPNRLRQAADDARRRRLTDWSHLASTLAVHARRGRGGTAAFRALLEHYLGRDELPLSDWSNAVADLLADAGLPRPVAEHPVTDGRGFQARLDLAYPWAMLGIELDSLAWHFNHDSFHRDPVRRNRLLNLGWRVLTFTWTEFAQHPERLVETVRSALAPAARSTSDTGAG
jgi:hypothetical protein